MILFIVLGGLFNLAYVGTLSLSVINIVESPAFEPKARRFDLRYRQGGFVTMIQAKPSLINWETPEEAHIEVQDEIAYIPVFA